MFKSADKAALQEIGPRFTLKLRYLRTGTPAVDQLGAAPPSLTFDREDDSEETGGQEGKDAPSEIGQPPQGEGYIWAWKV
jgi:ribosome production factor 1